MYKSESFGATFDMVFLADVTTQHALDSAEYKIEQLPRFNQNSSSWSSQNDKQKNIERVDQKSLTWNVGPFWDSQNTNYDYSEGEQASVATPRLEFHWLRRSPWPVAWPPPHVRHTFTQSQPAGFTKTLTMVV
jgi:hypothetical protein